MTERISAERAREMLEAATPGSWAVTVNRESGGQPFEAWVHGDRFGAVATVSLIQHMGDVRTRAEAAVQGAADAALVAAAPDLCRAVIAQAEEIAALREVVEAAREHQDCTHLCRMMDDYRGCTCGGEDLRSALARLDAMTEVEADGPRPPAPVRRLW